jgi:hypothetical protein
MQFAFDIVYDEASLKRAVDTFVIRRLKTGFGWLGMLAVVITVAAVAQLLWQGDRSWLVGAIAAGLLFFALLITLLWQWRLKDVRAKLAAINDGKAHVTLTDKDFMISTVAGGTTLPWAVFTDLWKLESCWLLFLAPNNFVTLPIAGVSPQALEFIDGKIQTHSAGER